MYDALGNFEELQEDKTGLKLSYCGRFDESRSFPFDGSGTVNIALMIFYFKLSLSNIVTTLILAIALL